MAPGTIRNLVCKKKLKQNIHYLKPTSRKLLFIWREVDAWLHEPSIKADDESDIRAESRIKI